MKTGFIPTPLGDPPHGAEIGVKFRQRLQGQKVNLGGQAKISGRQAGLFDRRFFNAWRIAGLAKEIVRPAFKRISAGRSSSLLP